MFYVTCILRQWKKHFCYLKWNICKGLPCLKLGQAYLMKYWLGPTYLFTAWTREKCYAIFTFCMNRQSWFDCSGWPLSGPLWIIHCSLFSFNYLRKGGGLICILIFIVVTCQALEEFIILLSLILSSGRLKYQTMQYSQTAARQYQGKLWFFFWLQFSSARYIILFDFYYYLVFIQLQKVPWNHFEPLLINGPVLYGFSTLPPQTLSKCWLWKYAFG